jgi:hypothetical protein
MTLRDSVLCLGSQATTDEEVFDTLDTSSPSSDSEGTRTQAPSSPSGHRQQAEIQARPAGSRRIHIAADALSFFEADGVMN